MTECKYVVFDLMDQTYLIRDFNNTESWINSVGFCTIFSTEEEAWKYAGIYCTVIKVRIN